MKTAKFLKSSLLVLLAVFSMFLASGHYVHAEARSWSPFYQYKTDTDGDGLPDFKEVYLYGTNPSNKDTNGDGISDRDELMMGRDPNSTNAQILQKHIYVSLKYQELRYYTGPYLMDDFSVSTGVPGKDTPTGEFSVIRKVPFVLYKGTGYYYPNTKWNLMFKPGYYIHGAYWHNNFGNKMSHGCVNVSYTDVEPLYNWADQGTAVTILNEDFPSGLNMYLPSNTLLQDGKTIFLIMNGKKYGISSMNVFNSLGYSLKNVRKGSSSGIAEGYVLNSGMNAPT